MRIRLNEKWLDRLPAPGPGVNEEYRDAQTPGLYVRHFGPPSQEDDTEAERRARSTMTFMWRRAQDGTRHTKKLGQRGPGFDLAAAKDAATKWNVRLADRTMEEETSRRANIPTLTELYQSFRKEYKKKLTPRSLEGYDRLAELFGDLGSTRITNLKRADLVDLHSDIGETRKRTANRVLALASRLWEFAADNEKV